MSTRIESVVFVELTVSEDLEHFHDLKTVSNPEIVTDSCLRKATAVRVVEGTLVIYHFEESTLEGGTPIEKLRSRTTGDAVIATLLSVYDEWYESAYNRRLDRLQPAYKVIPNTISDLGPFGTIDWKRIDGVEDITLYAPSGKELFGFTVDPNTAKTMLPAWVTREPNRSLAGYGKDTFCLNKPEITPEEFVKVLSNSPQPKARLFLMETGMVLVDQGGQITPLPFN